MPDASAQVHYGTEGHLSNSCNLEKGIGQQSYLLAPFLFNLLCFKFQQILSFL